MYEQGPISKITFFLPNPIVSDCCRICDGAIYLCYNYRIVMDMGNNTN